MVMYNKSKSPAKPAQRAVALSATRGFAAAAAASAKVPHTLLERQRTEPPMMATADALTAAAGTSPRAAAISSVA